MLDPEVCAETYEMPNVMARESYRLGRERVESFDDLIDVCVDYYMHHVARVLAPVQGSPMEHIRGTVSNLVDEHYEGGREAAYKAASRGISGGLPGVLDAIRDYFLKDMEERYFDHTVMESVDIMDLEDIETLMEQYLQRYGRHMDGDNLPSAKFLVPKYKQVLKAHANVVRRMRMYFGR